MCRGTKLTLRHKETPTLLTPRPSTVELHLKRDFYDEYEDTRCESCDAGAGTEPEVGGGNRTGLG